MYRYVNIGPKRSAKQWFLYQRKFHMLAFFGDHISTDSREKIPALSQRSNPMTTGMSCNLRIL